MKRPSCAVGLAAALVLPGLLGGCVATRHGHVAWVVPPIAAAALTVAAAARVGQVWVDGHWDWVDGGWRWSEGFWVAEQPGLVWEQGIWLHGHDHYVWRPGRWRAPAKIEVRDHRR